MALLAPQAFSSVPVNLKVLHSESLKQHVYITDMDQYGVVNRWVPSLKGDCGDYALYIQQELRKQGIKADLWIVKTETEELHVVTLIGDYVIDNRHRPVMIAKDLPYIWLAPVVYYND